MRNPRNTGAQAHYLKNKQDLAILFSAVVIFFLSNIDIYIYKYRYHPTCFLNKVHNFMFITLYDQKFKLGLLMTSTRTPNKS